MQDELRLTLNVSRCAKSKNDNTPKVSLTDRIPLYLKLYKYHPK